MPRRDADSALLRLLPVAGISLWLLTGCHVLSQHTAPNSNGANQAAAVAAVADVVASRGAAPREERTGAEPQSRPAVVSVEGLLGAGSTRPSGVVVVRRPTGRDAEIAASADVSPGPARQSWFENDDLYHLPSGFGRETLFRPVLVRGLASPVNWDSPGVTPADGDGSNALASFSEQGDVAENTSVFGDAVADPANLVEPPPISWWEDFKDIPSMLWHDNCALYTWPNALVLGVAAGGAVAIRDNLDHRVREETAEHPLLWGEGSEVLRQFGEFSYQVPVLAGVYGLGLLFDDDNLHEFSKAAISAYSLTAAYTVAIKGITNTQRPTNQFQDGHYGFPSYHTASTFCLAAVIDEYCGWEYGVPAYVLAGLVGWSRIDQREHDLSDVIFGSVLGFVIGKSVAAAHIERHANYHVTPYYDPATRTAGVSVDTQW